MRKTSDEQHTNHMTRRSFVKAAAAAGGAVALTGLSSCGAQAASSGSSATDASSAQSAPASAAAPSPSASGPSAAASPTAAAAQAAPAVYFTRAVDAKALRAVFDSIGTGLSGKIGVKVSTGEPGGNHYLKADLIADLVHAVDGTIVECNTAYGGQRGSTEAHYQVAQDHGFADIADFQVMDEDGSPSLPVEGGLHLDESLVGAHFSDYDGFLVLSHFKGHAMAGFGEALKNISIGMASSEGKLLIHSAGENRTSWESASMKMLAYCTATP